MEKNGFNQNVNYFPVESIQDGTKGKLTGESGFHCTNQCVQFDLQ